MSSVADRYEFRVRWEPFLLRPNMPPEGIEKPAHMRQSTGGHLSQAGAAVGIDFTYKSERFPYTLPAHVFQEYAKEVDGGSKQNDVAERLFKSYFTDGEILKLDTILKIAKEVGFNENEVKNYVTDKNNLEATKEKALNWSRKGVTGVPCFYMNGQRTFSGAQDPPAFLQVFDIVAKNSANM